MPATRRRTRPWTPVYAGRLTGRTGAETVRLGGTAHGVAVHWGTAESDGMSDEEPGAVPSGHGPSRVGGASGPVCCWSWCSWRPMSSPRPSGWSPVSSRGRGRRPFGRITYEATGTVEDVTDHPTW